MQVLSQLQRHAQVLSMLQCEPHQCVTPHVAKCFLVAERHIICKVSQK